MFEIIHSYAHDTVYIISTTITVIAFFFSLYHKKHFGTQAIAVITLMMLAQILWKYIPECLADNLYDIAIIGATICIIKSRMYIRKVYNICPLAKDCEKNPNNKSKCDGNYK